MGRFAHHSGYFEIKCYTATVWILTRLRMNSSSTGTSSLSSFRQEIWRFIASLTCSIVSSTVSPCEKHPGSAGTSAQKPPSSALWIKNRVFPGIFPYNHCANSSSVKPAILIAALRSPILTVPETGMVRSSRQEMDVVPEVMIIILLFLVKRVQVITCPPADLKRIN